jgi:hypothetical protein
MFLKVLLNFAILINSIVFNQLKLFLYFEGH